MQRKFVVLLFLVMLGFFSSCRMSDRFIFDKWENYVSEKEVFYRYIPYTFVDVCTRRNVLELAIVPSVLTNQNSSFLRFLEVHRLYTNFSSCLDVYDRPLPCTNTSLVQVEYFDGDNNSLSQDRFQIEVDDTSLDLGSNFYGKMCECDYAIFRIDGACFDLSYFPNNPPRQLSFRVGSIPENCQLKLI